FGMDVRHSDRGMVDQHLTAAVCAVPPVRKVGLVVTLELVLAAGNANIVLRPQREAANRRSRHAAAGFAVAITLRRRLAGNFDFDLAAKTLALLGLLRLRCAA